MVWWWWIIPAIVGVVGLAIVLSGLGWMFRGKPFKGGRGVVGGGFMLAVAAIVALVAMNAQTYNRLSFERPVATLQLKKIADRTFEATVVEIDDDGEALGEPQVYTLTGDQWQVDARVITWKDWANVVGLDSQYELQRIWGRNITGPARNTANGQELKINRPGIDVLKLSEVLGGLSPVSVQKREFGNAVFMPMVDGANYEIRITQQGLAVDPGNQIAVGAIETGGLYMRAAQEAAAEQGGE